MKIRIAKLEDIEQLWEFEMNHRIHDNNILWAKLSDLYNYGFWEVDKKDFSDQLSEYLSRKDMKILIAEENKKVVWSIIWEIKSLFKSDKWYIVDLFIASEYRSKWYGQLLVQEMLCWFKEYNIEYVNLWVLSNNSKALEFYKKLWFEEFLVKMTKKI